MYRIILKYILPIFTCYMITEVLASECDNCDDYDQYCCDGGCCYYTNYSYWNLWYFWFIVIFVLMTCFGGCGYYRRRQVYLQTVNGQRIPVGQTTYLTTGVQPTGVAVHHPYHAATAPPVGAFPSPPPYSEVTSKPNLYPQPADPAYPPQSQYYQSQFYQYPAAATANNQPSPPEYIPPQTTTNPQTGNAS